MFTCLAVVTGSLWGKPLGNLVGLGCKNNFHAGFNSFLCSLYFIQQADRPPRKANKISSLIAVVGAINIPIIKYSVEWWNTLHQPASIKIDGTSTIHSSMLAPLMLMLLVLLLYCALIF